MDAELELILGFCMSLIFLVLYFRYNGEWFRVLFSLLATTSFMATAQLFVMAQPNEYGLTWLFYAIGMCFIAFTLVDILWQIHQVLVTRRHTYGGDYYR